MYRLLPSWLILCVLAGLAAGCWDAREVEERSTVMAIGLDSHPAGYEVSIQVPIPIKIVGSGGGGGGEGGQNAVELFTGSGRTLTEALNDIENQSNQQLFYGHARIIVIGEELAEKGVRPLLDALRRHPEIRRRQWPLVVKGKAKDAMKTTPKLEQIPMEYIVTMIENGIRAGRFADVTLGDLFIDLSNPAKEPVLNYAELTPQKNRWLGLALFQEGRMVGKLSRKESQHLLRILAAQTGETTEIPCANGKGHVVFRPKEVGRKYHVRTRGGLPDIHIHLHIQGEIIEKTCDLDLSQPGAYQKVNRWAASLYEREMRQVVRKVQKEMRTDAFMIGNHIHAYHPDLWERLEWDRDFPRSRIRVTCDVQTLRMGLEAK